MEHISKLIEDFTEEQEKIHFHKIKEILILNDIELGLDLINYSKNNAKILMNRLRKENYIVYVQNSYKCDQIKVEEKDGCVSVTATKHVGEVKIYKLIGSEE